MQSRVSLVAKNASPQCHLSFLTGEDSTQTEEKLALKIYYLIGQTLLLPTSSALFTFQKLPLVGRSPRLFHLQIYILTY